MFYSDFAGKEVMTVKGADSLGAVSGIYIDKTSKRPTALAVGNAALPLKKIVGSNEKITVYSKEHLTEPDTEKLFLLHAGIEAFNEDGSRLGAFVDITVTGDRLIWFDKPYPVKYIAGTADGRIIINLNIRLRNSYTSEPKQPNKVQVTEKAPAGDYNFLLGRIVIRDIVDRHSGIVIRKGTVISNAVLEQAKRGGKLVYLALSSLLD